MTTKLTSTKQPSIEVCYGPECSDHGGRELAEEIHALGLKAIMGDCRDQCPNAPMVLVDKRMICDATVEKVATRVNAIMNDTKNS